jgi:23S rRNA pseudouridine1911/1915/1917 synthase
MLSSPETEPTARARPAEPDGGPPAAIPVLFEDADVLAVDKPAGLVVHPAYRHPAGTLFDVVAARQEARGEGRPWLLHRLDRDTSGAVLLAKTERARRGLVRQFERREVRKWYLALVRGVPAPPANEIAVPLRRDPADRRRVVVDPAGQHAQTGYRLLAAGAGRALLLVAPRTGRTHQIRAHLAWLGHPLLGDATYADVAKGPGGVLRHMLHAWVLAVRHPVTGEPLRVLAPPPADLAALLPAAWRAVLTDELLDRVDRAAPP